jgi:hypothetical protein
VAASSIRPSIPAAPRPQSQKGDVQEGDAEVAAQAGLGHCARCLGRAEQIGRRCLDVVAPPVDLVGPVAEDAVELGLRDRHDVGMGDPGPVEAVCRLARLVLADRLECPSVCLGVLAAGDQRCHSADRERAARVTGLDQQLGVGAHERHRHRDAAAVGQDEVAATAEALEHREDVVPATGVESAGALAELEQDLVHLERRRHRLDQDRGPQAPARQASPRRRSRRRAT